MVNLFNIENHIIDTSKFNHVLHDNCVKEFENTIANYVGAKYACGVSSATNAIYLAMSKHNHWPTVVEIPSMIPPVVANAIITSNHKVDFKDDVDWVGDSYILKHFTMWGEEKDYKIIDSAQKLEKNQFKKEANDEDLMIFSFYPTKPVGSIDGGMVVSNDKEKIDWFREATLNGMGWANNNWERTIKFPGWKMYLNSTQAYVANENFKKYSRKLEILKRIKKYYNDQFGYNNTSNHLYRVKVKNNKEVLKKLKNKGIVTGIHYKCLHNHPVYNYKFNKMQFHHEGKFRKSELEEQQTLSIPFHEGLNHWDIENVVKNVKKYII